MTIERMMDEVIRKYGFEDGRTITFCCLCDDWKKGVLSIDEIIQEYFETLK